MISMIFSDGYYLKTQEVSLFITLYGVGESSGFINSLKRLGYLESWIFEYEFRDIFPKIYGIPDRHLRNDA